ncbi:MAG: Uncharacterized MFS-type transporter, partial [uncultured Nocardioidaceae bacterium]
DGHRSGGRRQRRRSGPAPHRRRPGRGAGTRRAGEHRGHRGRGRARQGRLGQRVAGGPGADHAGARRCRRVVLPVPADGPTRPSGGARRGLPRRRDRRSDPRRRRRCGLLRRPAARGGAARLEQRHELPGAVRRGRPRHTDQPGPGAVDGALGDHVRSRARSQPGRPGRGPRVRRLAAPAHRPLPGLGLRRAGSRNGHRGAAAPRPPAAGSRARRSPGGGGAPRDVLAPGPGARRSAPRHRRRCPGDVGRPRRDGGGDDHDPVAHGPRRRRPRGHRVRDQRPRPRDVLLLAVHRRAGRPDRAPHHAAHRWRDPVGVAVAQRHRAGGRLDPDRHRPVPARPGLELLHGVGLGADHRLHAHRGADRRAGRRRHAHEHLGGNRRAACRGGRGGAGLRGAERLRGDPRAGRPRGGRRRSAGTAVVL